MMIKEVDDIFFHQGDFDHNPGDFNVKTQLSTIQLVQIEQNKI